MSEAKNSADPMAKLSYVEQMQVISALGQEMSRAGMVPSPEQVRNRLETTREEGEALNWAAERRASAQARHVCNGTCQGRVSSAKTAEYRPASVDNKQPATKPPTVQSVIDGIKRLTRKIDATQRDSFLSSVNAEVQQHPGVVASVNTEQGTVRTVLLPVPYYRKK